MYNRKSYRFPHHLWQSNIIVQVSVNVEFEAVAENCGYWPGNDVQLDVDDDSTNKYNAYWTISSTPFVGIGTDSGGSYDAYIKVKLEKAVAEKARVIIINGTGDDGDYGLDTVSTGIYRYSADDQVYLLDLNVSAANGRFQQGMNTIILPRAIALQCQLNDTLYDLASISSGDPLYGASFYSTDSASTSASAHVIAVISKNVTATQAEAILTKLTHNATGGRIGNNVTISSTSLYLLHLPNDILSAIPTFVKNDGMGEGPNYLDPFAVISDIAGMAFDFLVWVASGGVLLLFVHLVEIGLEAIGNMLAAAAAAVQDAVDAMVDAFCAFVDWVKEVIDQFIDSILGSAINELGDSASSYSSSVGAACLSADAEIEASGTVTEKTRADVLKTICGSLFFYICGLIMLAEVFFLAIKVVTGGFGFVASLAISALVTTLVVTALGSFVAYGNYETNPSEAFHDFISGVICSAGGNLSAGGVLSDVLDAVLGLIDIISTAAMGVISSIPTKISSGVAADVALGIVGLILGISGAVIGSKFLEIMALTLSGFGFFKTLLSIFELKKMNNIAGKDVAILSAILSGCGIGISLYGLSQEEWF